MSKKIKFFTFRLYSMQVNEKLSLLYYCKKFQLLAFFPLVFQEHFLNHQVIAFSIKHHSLTLSKLQSKFDFVSIHAFLLVTYLFLMAFFSPRPTIALEQQHLTRVEALRPSLLSSSQVSEFCLHPILPLKNEKSIESRQCPYQLHCASDY